MKNPKNIRLTLAALALATTGAYAAPVVVDTETYNGHTYLLLSGASWTDSEAAAVALGGHLTTINDAAENAFVHSRFGLTRSVSLWIGLRRSVAHGPFSWVDGDAAAYTNWEGGEPNDCCGGEAYTHMYSSIGTWNDLPDVSTYFAPQQGVVEISAAAVPEPQTLGLVLAGLGAAGFFGRRRKV
jgi:hypothetical protein